VTTKVSQPTTIVDRPATIAQQAERDEVIAAARQILDELREQVKALTAELAQRDEYIRAQADTIVELGQSLILCQKERKTLEEELSRPRALESAVKSLFLYVPGALDEILDDSDGRFARDAVAEALGLVREVVKDD